MRKAMIYLAKEVTSSALRTAIYIWKTRRREKAARWRYKRSKAAPEIFIVYAKITSKRLSTFAWYVLLVNVGGLPR
jgi:hypothetical protein